MTQPASNPEAESTHGQHASLPTRTSQEPPSQQSSRDAYYQHRQTETLHRLARQVYTRGEEG